MDSLQVAHSVFGDPSRAFTVKLWDGSMLRADIDRAPGSELVIRDVGALELFVPPVSERRLAEAYIGERIELAGEPAALLEAAATWSGPPLVASVRALASRLIEAVHSNDDNGLVARTNGRRHEPARDKSAIHHHYDHPRGFYALFLDPSLTYSCAYFETGDETLEEAQTKKQELVCRKLGLRAGDRLLDVGCGSGGLLVHAARAHGALGTGITLSETQLETAEDRVARERLDRNVDVRLLDYRDLDSLGRFDKISSIGMMEHVGSERLSAYFESLGRVLRPGGLFLNHAIADISGRHRLLDWAVRLRGGFIERYIFPDSELVPIEIVIREAEKAGFEVRDLESLREHYVKTLDQWLARLDARREEAVRIVGRPAVRAFRLYLAASSAAFRLGKISVFQLLLAKRLPSGRVESLPRSRGDWYARARTSP